MSFKVSSAAKIMQEDELTDKRSPYLYSQLVIRVPLPFYHLKKPATVIL